FATPRALCSANLDLRSSSVRGSPEEERRSVKRRSVTHSGSMSDVRKSLAGGSAGNCLCSDEGVNQSSSNGRLLLRLGSDLLLRHVNNKS
ncbi:hypothetical protein BDR05DRAFT_872496, partial [Suillus weaverae]